MVDKSKVNAILNRVRDNNPLIHNITNIVAANFSANGLLALGASPVMADAVEEAPDMASAADAVVLNMGTLNSEKSKALMLAGKSANQHSIPVILDPVGVGALANRTRVAQLLIKEVKVSIIRGNAAEVANLIGQKWEIKGVNAGYAKGNVVELASDAALKLNSIVVITGKDDLISDGNTTYMVHNGHPLLTKVTGTGCLLSAVIGAFSAVEKNLLEAAVSALIYYGVAAQVAAENIDDQGPGSFQIEFINQLALVSSTEIDLYSSFDIV